MLPGGCDARRAEHAAAAHGIDVLALSRLAREVELPGALLLGFGVVPESAMEGSVVQLARALATVRPAGRG
jgi:DNA-binding transcriptional MocR family regulator